MIGGSCEHLEERGARAGDLAREPEAPRLERLDTGRRRQRDTERGDTEKRDDDQKGEHPKDA